MQDKLKIWRPDRSWEEASSEWDQGSRKHETTSPLKTLKTLPQMPGITKETAKGLKWKSIKYILSHDKERVFLRYFFYHPLQYTLRWVKSALKKKSFHRDGDFFLYGLKNVQAFIEGIKKKDVVLVVGFSYCHKPFECPSLRFSPECIHDPEHPVCRQCFIGKTVNALPSLNLETAVGDGKLTQPFDSESCITSPSRTAVSRLNHRQIIPLFIPTIHYIGEKIFEIAEANPGKQILFLITACEMTLEMFGNWGNMVDIRGIGVRLDGRICNTMKAFELSEAGIKPGLTVVLPETQEQILSFIRQMWE